MKIKNGLFSKVFLLGIFVLGISVAGCVAKGGGKVLARFDGGVITEADYTAKLKSLPSEVQKVVSGRKKEFVGELVDEQVLILEAKKRNIQDDPDVKSVLDAAHRKIVVSKLIETEVDKKVQLGPDEALNHYNTHKEEYAAPLLLRASHILLSTEAEATAVRAELAAGADFEELARKKSQDSTAIRGGDLGFFQKGQMIPEFEEVVFKMKKGEISPAFKTQFGYHIVKFTDRAEPAVRDFVAVRAIIEKQLVNQKRVATYKEFMQKLKTGKKIEIDEKALEAIA